VKGWMLTPVDFAMRSKLLLVIVVFTSLWTAYPASAVVFNVTYSGALAGGSSSGWPFLPSGSLAGDLAVITLQYDTTEGIYTAFNPTGSSSLISSDVLWERPAFNI
jgi:hypothetical protein